MSTPPVPPDRHDDELDPTGIRDLLSRLPDPGPMPADLVDRINASIAREESARSRPVVVPLRRRSVWPKVAVAAAAVAVVGVGVPALLGGGGNPVTTAFSESAVDDSGAGSAADSAAGSAGPSEPLPSLSDPATTMRPETRAARRDGSVSMVMSGTAYTSTALPVQAQQLVGAAAGTAVTGGDASRSDGPADTDHGLRDCLHGLGVEDWQPVTADLATFEGEHAVVAVVDSDTGQVVWVVPPDCTAATPRSLAGPLPLG